MMAVNKYGKGRAVVAIVLFLIAIACPASAGTAGEAGVKTVTAGSAVGVSFICRLKTGEVVAATDKAVGQDKAVRKAPVFLERDGDGPLSLTASDSPVSEGKELTFEQEITNRLAAVVIGMKEGQRRKVELTARDIPERRKEDYVVSVARVRERLKEMRIPIAKYRSRLGKEPKKGQPFIIDPAIPGRVASVTGDEVVVNFYARPGDVVKTPFGPGHIRETKKTYEIVIDAKKGDLVRSGGFVGRITAVDEKSITIDYRNPFGGEPLECDVTVDKITDQKTGKDVAGK